MFLRRIVCARSLSILLYRHERPLWILETGRGRREDIEVVLAAAFELRRKRLVGWVVCDGNEWVGTRCWMWGGWVTQSGASYPR